MAVPVPALGAPARPGLLRSRRALVDPGDRAAALGGGAVALGGVVALLVVITSVDADTWVPILVVIGLLAVSVPMCLLAASPPSDPTLRKILLAALVLKLLCTFPRYLMNEVAYDGSADAGSYHAAGQVVHDNVEQGHWSLEGATIDPLPDETRTVGYVVGAAYLVVGTSQMSAYLLFAWVSWVGLMGMLAAFRVAYPTARPHLAAALLLFLPSLLYWPSSIGKDALMVFALGLVSLGMARMLTATRPLRGLVAFAAGSLVMAQIRPHLLLVVAVGGVASLLARRVASDGPRSVRQDRAALAMRVVTLVALVPVLLVGVARMDEMFGAPSDGRPTTVAALLDQTAERTSTGGSQLSTQSVHSPLDLPVALVSVTYRPFVFEAGSLPSFISALEGTLLLVLTALGARWLWRMGPAAWRHPFGAFCAAYVVAFVIAFSNIGNAGILARQRVQMFPVLILLVAAAAASRPHRAAVDLRDPTPTHDTRMALIP